MYPICLRAAVVVGFSIAFSSAAHAESKYNPYTKQWEDVSPNAYPQLNPITGKWELAPPGSVPKLNPYTREYHLVSPDSVARFNPSTRQWELAPPDTSLQLNRETNTWHYTRSHSRGPDLPLNILEAAQRPVKVFSQFWREADLWIAGCRIFRLDR